MNQNVRAASFGALALATGIALGGCFGPSEPSESDMLAAIKNNSRVRMAFAMMANSGGMVRPGAYRANPQDALNAAVVQKTGCAAAQGAPGFVCDFRLGLKRPGGKVEYAPPGKGRFFKAGGGWAVEPVH